MCAGRGAQGARGALWPLATAGRGDAKDSGCAQRPPAVPAMGLSPSSALISCLGAQAVAGLLQPRLCRDGGEASCAPDAAPRRVSASGRLCGAGRFSAGMFGPGFPGFPGGNIPILAASVSLAHETAPP